MSEAKLREPGNKRVEDNIQNIIQIRPGKVSNLMENSPTHKNTKKFMHISCEYF